MFPGEDTFNTGLQEVMEIISGERDDLLPGSETWTEVRAGESFNVPENSQVQVKSYCDDCCSFFK